VGTFDRHTLQHTNNKKKWVQDNLAQEAQPCSTESGSATLHTMTLVSILPVAKRLLLGAQDKAVILAAWYCQSFWLTCKIREKKTRMTAIMALEKGVAVMCDVAAAAAAAAAAVDVVGCG
jgi:hypothetical protein